MQHPCVHVRSLVPRSELWQELEQQRLCGLVLLQCEQFVVEHQLEQGFAAILYRKAVSFSALPTRRLSSGYKFRRFNISA